MHKTRESIDEQQKQLFNIKIEINKQQRLEDVLEIYGNIMYIGNSKYYFLPLCFEMDELDGSVYAHHINNIEGELKEILGYNSENLTE